MKGYFIIFGILIFSAMCFILIPVLMQRFSKLRVKKVGSVDGKKLLITKKDELMRVINKSTYLTDFIREMTMRFSVLNTRNRDFNELLAILSLVVAVLVTVVFSVIMTAVTFPMWYLGMVYSLIFAGGMCLVFMTVSEFCVNLFIKHLPETFRILNSRYASRGNILKAISASMEDFHPIVRREMVRIYDALKQNDMEKIRETFNETEEKYPGEHVTLMLELIRHAYYNGGDEVVKTQFDLITEDIIDELENKKDARQASMSYIIMSVLFIPLLPLACVFNNGILGEDSVEFYSSITGTCYAVIFFLAVFALIAIIVFMERKER